MTTDPQWALRRCLAIRHYFSNEFTPATFYTFSSSPANLQHPFPLPCPQLKVLPPISLRWGREGLHPLVTVCPLRPPPHIVFPRSVITSAASFSQWRWTPLLTSQKSSLLQFSLSLLCHHFFFPNQQANTLWYLNSKYINKWKLTLNSPITLPFQLLLLSSIFLYSKFPLQKFLYVLSVSSTPEPQCSCCCRVDSDLHTARPSV